MHVLFVDLSPYDLYLETSVGWCVTRPVCWLEGERDWLIGDDDQLRDLVGSSDHFRPSCSVNHVIYFVTWSVKPRDQLRDCSEGHAIG